MAQKDDKVQTEEDDAEDRDKHHNSTKRYDDIVSYEIPKPHAKRSNVDIHDPMFLWIIVLMAAVVIRIVLATTSYLPTQTQAYTIQTTFSNFILQFPGIAILPLIIGAIIGSEVGERSNSLASALKSGLTNGIYAAIIYLVTIVIIYIILNYATPQFSSLYLTVLNSVVLPILVFLITLEIFAALAYSRRVDE